MVSVRWSAAVSQESQVVADEQPEAPALTPTTVKAVELENTSATDLARKIYVVFSKRAELQKRASKDFLRLPFMIVQKMVRRIKPCLRSFASPSIRKQTGC